MTAFLENIFISVLEIKGTIGGAFLAFFGGYIPYYEKRRQNKADGKSNRTNNLAMMIMSIGCLSTISSGWYSNKEKSNATAKADSVNNLLIAKSNSLEQLQKEEID